MIPVSAASLNEDFDPQRSYWGTAWELFRCCLIRTLISYDVDPANRGKVVLRPDLAAGEPVVSDDALAWTFHLKPGLHYGPPLEDVPIVSGDIVRAIERAGDGRIAPDGASVYFSVIGGFSEYQAGEADSISGLETPDDRTLVIRLTRPIGDLPFLVALPGSAPIPPNPYDRTARYGAATGHRRYGSFLVSSGPYMIDGSPALDLNVPPSDQEALSGFVPGKSLTLVRNPSWNRRSDPLRPALAERIVVTIGGSRAEAFDAVESGAADVLFETLAGIDARIHDLRAAGLEERVHVDDGMSTVFISFNVAMPPFDDVHVRRAVNLVVDKRRIMELAESFEGSYLDPVNRIATHIAPNVMEDGLLLGYDPYASSGDHGDIEKARREMARSRYDSDGDGMCDRPACRGMVVPVNPAFVGRAGSTIVVRNLRSIGLHVRPKVSSFADIVGITEDPASHVPLIVARGWISDYPSGSTFFVPLFARDGGFNSSLLGATPEDLRRWGYPVEEVPSVDARIAECQGVAGTEQGACWAGLDKFLMEDVTPVVPLIWGRRAIIVSDRVTRYSYDPLTLTPALDQIALRAT